MALLAVTLKDTPNLVMTADSRHSFGTVIREKATLRQKVGF